MQVKRAKIQGAHSILLNDIRNLQISRHYPELVEKLRCDLSETGDANLRRLISEASEDRRLTGLIYSQAKRRREEANLNWDMKMGKWMVEGRAAIAALKKAKEWDGQVTVTDVERWVLANIEEAKSEKLKVLEAEEIYGTAKSIYQAYEYRLSALQSYAKLREVQIRLSLEDIAEQRRNKK